jgi:hypothetical protein
MSKTLRALVLMASATFAEVAPVSAQTIPEAARQRPTESVPVCVPTTIATQDGTPASSSLTVYNPVMTSGPSLTFYTPSNFPRPPLTYYTPLGQIDPPIATRPPSPPAAQTPQTTQSPSSTSTQSPMPQTETIPAPGPCPPGTQLERR